MNEVETLTGPQVCDCEDLAAAAVTDKSWDGDSSRFTPEEWRSSTILHRGAAKGQDALTKSLHSLPIREPDGTLNRNGVHAAAARINQVTDATAEERAEARAALRRAYEQLDEALPESLEASAALTPGGFGGPRMPAAWFVDPQLDAPTHPTVTDAGRVFGHVALWDTCHRAYEAERGTCKTPPRSQTAYSQFLHGYLDTEDGRVPVGQITMQTAHPLPIGNVTDKLFHYSHTGFAFADVTVGEDEHGLWFSGAMRPSRADAVGQFTASSLSGHWVNGELIAVLAVNVPGYLVPPTPSAVLDLAAAAHPENDPWRVFAGLVADEVMKRSDLRRRASVARKTLRERL